MKIGIVDNYDSFTYNLVHYLHDITGEEPVVWMNDQIDWTELHQCSHLLLSPGPGLPIESGHLMKVLQETVGKQSILGVCLGMQALGQHFGAGLINLHQVMHGVSSVLTIPDPLTARLYRGFDPTFSAGRYHSWVVDKNTLSAELIPTAFDERGDLMSFEHKYLPVYAVQFHPESIMTLKGKDILRNWLF